MNLMLFAIDFKPQSGGIAEFGHQIARGLTDMGEKVVVVGPDIDGAADFDRQAGYPVVRMNVGDPARRWPWQRLGRHLERRRVFGEVVRRYDVRHVLHADWGLLSWSASRWGRRIGLPYSVLVHGMEVTPGYSITVKPKGGPQGVRGAARVFANSHFTAEVVRSLGVPDERVKVIHPGVDPVEFQPATAGETERRRLGLGGRKVVLSVCRLVRRKGVDRSIEAMARVARSVPEAIYVIAGDGADRLYLEDLAAEQGMRERVRFLGSVAREELRALYRACDCFLMPSRQLPGGDVEGFGIVFLEANASGKPVVAGRSGGIPDAVQDGVTGFLVDPEDPEAIAQAVTRLLTDTDLARRMGSAGRRRVEQRFNWQTTVGELRRALLQAAGVAG